MSAFSFTKLEIEDVVCVDAFSAADSRGSFTKCFEKEIYRQAGIDFKVNETFVSVSAKNVIRGLHFQLHNPQAKLVSVLQGKVCDVVVDLRPESVTYKKWLAVELSAENHKAMYIPRGFAHGFVALENNSVMLYQCDGAYDKATDTGVVYNDPVLNIKWPIADADVICSEKDKSLMSFEEYNKKPMEV